MYLSAHENQNTPCADALSARGWPHNSRFEPLLEPTLRTGVKAMTSVAIALLQK
jgi:hypothetical protein